MPNIGENYDIFIKPPHRLRACCSAVTSSSNRRTAFALVAALSSAALLHPAFAETVTCASEQAAMPVVHYRTVKVDGVDIFYREAGPAGAPVVLLLHGFQPHRTCSAT
jgi:hypothetical protein